MFKYLELTLFLVCMRIALCFSGQLRDFGTTKKSLIRNILSVLSDHDVYSFAHFPIEDTADYCSIRFPFTKAVAEDERYVLLPSFAGVEHSVAERRWHDGNSLRAFFLQLRSLQYANQLRCEFEAEHGSFDWVIRLRYDNLYFGNYLESLELCNPDCVYIPCHDNWSGYNDRFAFGGSSVMNQYSNRVSEFKQYLANGARMHPEQLLKSMLERKSVTVKRTRVAHHLLRYGQLWRATYGEAYGDIPQPSRTSFGQIDELLYGMRFRKIINYLHLLKIKLSA